MKKILPALAVFLPILIITGWIGYHYAMRGAPTVVLEIEGYDPRDLLSGHYLIYRVSYGERGDCKNVATTGASCMCLDQETPAKASWLGTCDHLPPHCQLFLKGKCVRNRFEAGIERFYFPENYQSELKVVPPHSTIDVRISNGRGQVADLKIAGQPWKDFLKKKPPTP